jgi:hypothetical protein
MRSLLPDYLNAKLPESFTILHKIFNKLDRYLQKLPRKQVGESFLNLSKYMEKTFDI